MKRIAISGGFDPLHPGHIALIEDARKYGEVHIILNSDAWLVQKKGFFFQSIDARKKILEVYTSHIHSAQDSDGTVCESLREIYPDYFGSGGDRSMENTPEIKICEELGIKPVFQLGGKKYSSSSVLNARKRVVTRWGWYDVVLDMQRIKVKVLHVEAGKSLSLQRHNDRSEFFFLGNGEVRINLPEVWHVLGAPHDKALDVIEVQVGTSVESDIEKIYEHDAEFKKHKEQRIHLNE